MRERNTSRYNYDLEVLSRFQRLPVTAHFVTRELAARTGPQGPECLAKISKIDLKLHKNKPHFRFQEWAVYIVCYLAGGVTSSL